MYLHHAEAWETLLLSPYMPVTLHSVRGNKRFRGHNQRQIGNDTDSSNGSKPFMVS